MPVCGNYLFFELPKKIVLNPKDGTKVRITKYRFLCAHGAQPCAPLRKMFCRYAELSLSDRSGIRKKR